MPNQIASWRIKFSVAVIYLLGGLVIISRPMVAKARPGIAQATISTASSATQDPVVQFARSELTHYLEQITGQPAPLGKVSGNHQIFVGEIPPKVPATAAQKLRADLGELQEDGFIIRSVGPDLVILGRGSRGTLYGCYAWLEHLGVRWFFPGKPYEIVPHHNLDWDSNTNISESPAFPKRILFYWPNSYSPVLDWIDFSAKARLNRIAFHYTWPARDWYINQRARLLPELAKRGMEIEVAGHFLSSFLPRTLFNDHPEWFRMNDQGKRVNDFNLNPFNAEALDFLANGALKYLLQMPEANLFHLWADDIEGGGWSHEPGKSEYTPSDQALLVYNELAKRLREKLPQANLAFLAYHDTVYPPRVVKPEPGIVLFYAPRERCYAHALNDPECPLNQKYREALEHAMPAFPRGDSEVFEYYVDEILYENMTNPPLPGVLRADAEYYHQLGIPAVGALMTNTSEFVTPMTNMFLYPQALWDTQRDLNRSLQEYGALYLGDASLGTYFEELGRGLRDVLKICKYEHPGTAWDSVRAEAETDDALAYHIESLEQGIRGPLARAATQLDAALRRSKTKAYQERLHGEQVSLNYTLLQARLYYHLLKGERLYRLSTHSQDREAGLGALTESVLARYTWGQQKKLVARAGLKGNPLIPDPRPLEERAHDLERIILSDPARMGGVNPAGYGVDPLDEQLMKGVSGYIISGPLGSRAVLWTDVAASRAGLPPGAAGLTWQDEFGRELGRGAPDLFERPAVVDAHGMPADKLFDDLAASQSMP